MAKSVLICRTRKAQDCVQTANICKKLFFIGLITLKLLLCKVWQTVLEHFNVQFGPISCFAR